MDQPIEFGTDGWRAVIADGFTFENLGRVAQATAYWLGKTYGESPCVVMGHDTRFMGRAFAEHVACVLASYGVRVLFAETFVPTQAVGRRMLDRGHGCVINVASLLGERGAPNAAVFGAAQGALLGFTRSLGLEWVRGGVRVNAASALGKMGEVAKDAVPALIEALNDSHEQVRRKSASALGYIGAKARIAVPALIRALSVDESASVRSATARALGQIGDPAAVSALIKVLHDMDKVVRNGASAALVQIGKPAVSELIEALDHDSLAIRRRATIALGQIGEPEAVPALVKTLNDDYFLTRTDAADALGRIGHPMAVPALAERLSDEYLLVRVHADAALREIGTSEALKALETYE